MDEGMAGIRAELARRIAAIDGGGDTARLACDIDAIRMLAQAHRLASAVTVAQLFERALARGAQRTIVPAWLAMLGEAAACERHDRAACETFAAACAMRFAA